MIKELVPTTMGTGTDMVKRYLHWRAVSKEMHTRMMRFTPKGVLQEGARALGMLQGEVMVFDSEDQMGVLLDYCFHSVYHDGKNVTDLYAEQPDLGEDERVILEGIRRGRYSIFEVQERVPGTGVWVLDIFCEERLLVVDVNFSRTAPVGAMFASRTFPVEDFWMTGGAVLPVSAEAAAILVNQLTIWAWEGGSRWSNLTREQQTDFVRLVVRTCLRHSEGATIAYAEPGEKRWTSMERYEEGERSEPVRAEQRVGRNEPCPCGSGKKYKKCCALGR